MADVSCVVYNYFIKGVLCVICIFVHINRPRRRDSQTVCVAGPTAMCKYYLTQMR